MYINSFYIFIEFDKIYINIPISNVCERDETNTSCIFG